MTERTNERTNKMISEIVNEWCWWHCVIVQCHRLAPQCVRPTESYLRCCHVYPITALTLTSSHFSLSLVFFSFCIRYDTTRYDRWFALENWQASCQFNL